ncbi:MAG: hypothetical protein CFE41_21380 [Burkholderiales bacterium PBB2]|nr:MAG: hypothetical protein CFE41_21380 [Burkholderiales bacterium PBB2]
MAGDDGWGPDLWRFVANQVEFKFDLSPLRQEELSQVIHNRIVNYTVSRLIVGGCQAISPVRNIPDFRQEPLQQLVDDILDIDDQRRDRIVWYLDRICPRILSGANSLSRKQNSFIRGFAAQRDHRCYICGNFLHYRSKPYGNDNWDRIDEIRRNRAFEIEHVWCQARGGQKNIENLAASCNRCNKLKAELLSPVDLPIEAYVGSPSSESSVKTFLNAQLRFSLMWYQAGRCATCKTPFFELEDEVLVVALREREQPYHFFNMMICCAACDSSKKLQGVKFREPI